jgi:hypothetical protein
MKKSIKPFLVTLLLFCFMAFGYTGLAQVQEPPHPPAEKGSGYNHGPGNDAPVGEGYAILLVLSAAYGSLKFVRMRRKESVTE